MACEELFNQELKEAEEKIAALRLKLDPEAGGTGAGVQGTPPMLAVRKRRGLVHQIGADASAQHGFLTSLFSLCKCPKTQGIVNIPRWGMFFFFLLTLVYRCLQSLQMFATSSQPNFHKRASRRPCEAHCKADRIDPTLKFHSSMNNEGQ